MTPAFIYFDLGNVLFRFDHRRACRQMAEVAGVSAEAVWNVVFAGDLELRYEAGAIGDRQFYEILCSQLGTQPDYDLLLIAAADIFSLNPSIVPLVAQLMAARYRLGVLSNTNAAHWRFCSDGRYGLLLHGFEALALSYELGCLKPQPEIYERAAALAGVAPEQIFFTDDMPANVAGARSAGFDAVLYTDTRSLVAELAARGVRCNY